MMRLSELFGKDVFGISGEYKGKIYDIVVNLENGTLETMTTAPLKVKTKQDAKKIISDSSIPYKNVVSVKDILIVSTKPMKSEAPSIAAPATQEEPKKVPTGALTRYR